MPLLGKLAYHCWYRPMNPVFDSLRHGGPLSQWRAQRGQRDMIRAAAALEPPPRPANNELVPIHFLTGNDFWYQTAFCFYSYCLHSPELPPLVVHDDGSLQQKQIEPLKKLHPELQVRDCHASRRALEQHLPRQRYPILHGLWRDYVNIRKLIDVHLSAAGWKLVLDSDMLFFDRPEALLKWQRQPAGMLLMQDAKTSYGYGDSELEKLTGRPIPQKINVGICGLRSGDLDWLELEGWCRTLIEAQGHSYYLEQALVAALASRQPFTILDGQRYSLQCRRRAQASHKPALAHYVDLAKGRYFCRHWRQLLERASP